MQFLLYLICNILPLLLLIGNIAISFIVLVSLSLSFLPSCREYIFLSPCSADVFTIRITNIVLYLTFNMGSFLYAKRRREEKLNEITMQRDVRLKLVKFLNFFLSSFKETLFYTFFLSSKTHALLSPSIPPLCFISLSLFSLLTPQE